MGVFFYFECLVIIGHGIYVMTIVITKMVNVSNMSIISNKDINSFRLGIRNVVCD